MNMNTKMNVDKFISQHTHYSYCEVIILPDGYIVEAKPSHTETLIELWCSKHSKTREELKTLLIESSKPALHFICDELKCISVWYTCIYITSSGINSVQLTTLKKLVASECVNECVLTMIL